MNSINGTIDLLLSLVAREQRNADAAQPHDPAEEYRQQLQALLHSRQDDPALHRELLRLSGLHDALEARHAAFHFRAGVQLGLALGSMAILPDAPMD